MADIMDTILEAMDEAPEGVSLEVLTTDPDIAAEAAPMMARILFPDRAFGRVLHSEPSANGTEVVVEDLGPRLAHTRGAPPPVSARR